MLLTPARPQIVSLSGGKDSTAMLLMMLERGESVHSAVYFDAGEWEFPQMAAHIAQVEAMIAPVPLVRLEPKMSFLELMISRPVIPRTGPNKGKVRFLGCGWPSAMRRWCTREKADAIDKFSKGLRAVSCIGYAADESDRTLTKKIQGKATRYPLIEWGISEADALAYCRALGLTWSGLYDIFPRVSCFCCPLQSLPSLRKVRRHFPELWAKMLRWEEQMKHREFLRFKDEASVHDLEARFAEEDRWGFLPTAAAEALP